MGKWGLDTQNEEEQFLTWIKKRLGQEMPVYYLNIVLHHAESVHPTMTRVPVLPIHDMVHCLWEAGPENFKVSLLGSYTSAGRMDFIRHVMSLPEFQSNPLLQEQPDLTHVLPLMLHYDGAGMFRNQEQNIWSWSTVFSDKSDALDSQILLCSLPEGLMYTKAVKRAVHQEIARFCAWTLQCLHSGIHPSVGMYGEPLDAYRRGKAGRAITDERWRGFLFGVNADAKARVQIHGFQRYYRCNFVCEACLASALSQQCNPLLYHGDYSLEAPWRLTILSMENYLAIESTPSPYTRIPGFTISLAFRDLMHTLFLGFARDIIGSCIAEFRDYDLLPAGDTLQDQLRQLWLDARAWAKSMKVALAKPIFTDANTGLDNPNNYPALGSAFKAATIKTLLYWVSHFACTHAHAVVNQERYDLIQVLTFNITVFLKTLDSEPLLMSQQAADRAYRAGYAALIAYRSLHDLCARLGINRFLLRPKCHYFCHILDDMKRCLLSPRLAQVFSEESFMGVIVRVGRKCHGATATHRLMQRYLMHLQLRWRKAAGID
jgi:hypothetical protein